MKRFLVVLALLTAGLVAAPSGQVRALPPGIGPENNNLTINSNVVRGVTWPNCSTAEQEYCWEMPSVITPDGVETVMSVGALADPNQPQAGYVKGTPWTYCHNNDIESRANCLLDGNDWIEVQLTGEFTEQEKANTYRWKLRTGKFSPDIMMLSDAQKSVVAGNATDGFTLEVWAKPALFAYKSNCMMPTCGQNDVSERVSIKIQGYATMLMVGTSMTRPSVATAAQRDAMRGIFISTNAMNQSWSFSQDTFNVSATSPHFLPDGRTLTPGFVKVFLPGSYVLQDRGYTDISQVKPEFFDLKVSQASATAKVSVLNGGLLVDTGVEHFSSPNPSVKLKSAAETLAAQNLAALQQNSSASSGPNTVPVGNHVKTTISGIKATITVTLTAKGTFTVYRKVGKKLTLVKKVSGKKGANKVITSYLKGYSFVVKDAKGKTLAVRTTSVRFARFY